MADSNHSSSESELAEDVSEVESFDENDSSLDELQEIARQNNTYEHLKSKRNNYGFENLKVTSGTRKRKGSDAAGSKTKSKVPKKSNTKAARAPRAPKVPKSVTGNHAGNAANAPSNAPSTSNATKNSSDSGSSTANATENGHIWKHNAVSKSKYITQHFKIHSNGIGMTAVCKICNKPVSGTMGNNSNLMSHLVYVSA